MDDRIEGRKKARMDGWSVGKMDGRIDGWTDGWMDGRTGFKKGRMERTGTGTETGRKGDRTG